AVPDGERPAGRVDPAQERRSPLPEGTQPQEDHLARLAPFQLQEPRAEPEDHRHHPGRADLAPAAERHPYGVTVGPRLLTFDIFGTVIDWRRGLRESLRRHGAELRAEDFDSVIGAQ